MWQPTPGRMQAPGTSSTFWWCRPFAASQEPLTSMNRHQPLPAWRHKARMK